MDRDSAIAKARQFAQTAYNAALEQIVREYQDKLIEKRRQAAAQGSLGAIQGTTARLYAEQKTALLQARLDALLEGYERHNVELDDELSANIMMDVLNLRNTMTSQAVPQADLGAVSQQAFLGLAESYMNISPNSIKVQIDRRRFNPVKAPNALSTVTYVYHVYGHNPRWNTNSSDHSVNSVILQSDQVFVTLRQQIGLGVPEGEERKDILEKLEALEKAQETPSFAHRYTEFMSVAANHMTVICPFIPALTELLHRTLK